MKTREEIEELKRQWTRNPIWDIETSEGFEEYHKELEVYSLEWRIKWEHENLDRFIRHPDHFHPVSLAFEMDKSRQKIRELEDRFFEITKKLTMKFYA